jgi:hypothetical protein
MEARVCFCRFTQISLLRLPTTQAVTGADEVMTQTRARQIFDHCRKRRQIRLSVTYIPAASSHSLTN